MFRFIYGHLFGKDNFNAAFDDPQSFFKPFTLATVFAIVTSVVPLLVANICGLIFIEFGYQLFINCIEMTIIEVLLIALMIYEKIKLRAKLLRDITYYKVEPRLLDTTTNVMNSLANYTAAKSLKNLSSLYSNQTLKTTEGEALNPIEEHFNRRRHLEKIINFISYEPL
jgi:hypothetical protein